jgi:hypothetical protein
MRITDPNYLRMVRDGLHFGHYEINNSAALPAGISALYDAEWLDNSTAKERTRLTEFFAIWPLLKKEVSADFVASLMRDSSASMVEELILRFSRWFNSGDTGKYVLYHEKLRLFLLQKASKSDNTRILDAIILNCEVAVQKQAGDEWEFYALEHLSYHLSGGVKSGNNNYGEKIRKYALNPDFRNRQLEISGKYLWTHQTLQAMLEWCWLFKQSSIIDFGLATIETHFHEQTNFLGVLNQVRNREMDTVSERLRTFGIKDELAVNRRFILYMLCLWELTFGTETGGSEVHRRIALKDLLSQLYTEPSFRNGDGATFNWRNFMFSDVMLNLVREWHKMDVQNWQGLFERTDGWDTSWVLNNGPYDHRFLDVLEQLCDCFSLEGERAWAFLRIAEARIGQGLQGKSLLSKVQSFAEELGDELLIEKMEDLGSINPNRNENESSSPLNSEVRTSVFDYGPLTEKYLDIWNYSREDVEDEWIDCFHDGAMHIDLLFGFAKNLNDTASFSQHLVEGNKQPVFPGIWVRFPASESGNRETIRISHKLKFEKVIYHYQNLIVNPEDLLISENGILYRKDQKEIKLPYLDILMLDGEGIAPDDERLKLYYRSANIPEFPRALVHQISYNNTSWDEAVQSRICAQLSQKLYQSGKLGPAIVVAGKIQDDSIREQWKEILFDSIQKVLKDSASTKTLENLFRLYNLALAGEKNMAEKISDVEILVDWKRNVLRSAAQIDPALNFEFQEDPQMNFLNDPEFSNLESGLQEAIKSSDEALVYAQLEILENHVAQQPGAIQRVDMWKQTGRILVKEGNYEKAWKWNNTFKTQEARWQVGSAITFSISLLHLNTELFEKTLMNRNQKFEAVLHLLRLRTIDMLFFGQPTDEEVTRWDAVLDINWAIQLRNNLFLS